MNHKKKSWNTEISMMKICVRMCDNSQVEPEPYNMCNMYVRNEHLWRIPLVFQWNLLYFIGNRNLWNDFCAELWSRCFIFSFVSLFILYFFPLSLALFLSFTLPFFLPFFPFCPFSVFHSLLLIMTLTMMMMTEARLLKQRWPSENTVLMINWHQTW